jgi:hypothetical protein
MALASVLVRKFLKGISHGSIPQAKSWDRLYKTVCLWSIPRITIPFLELEFSEWKELPSNDSSK